ncbi:two-component system sensor histidine kinase GlrK [Pseudoduganella flava]|uniref:histidine kinase n=1 Tax=Pseudoduganella flava TaxID=871742 RepID=A0A562PU37_9BURK|nr:HAMP domain-containing sensor histidine kinase [Pseudoduganella flava]QGZ39048.1 HAMP domain-containing protein [Pseudoduganella flava]TWI47680.1 two-component system sensor histidine kinase GlrK [Pseudoduganella flava]
MPIKLSFRQLSLVAFLLIAALLSATSVHALLTLDRLAQHSREAGNDAIALTANAQRLAERSVAMERSARQFLVLNDPAFLERFGEAWRDALAALDAIAAALPGAEPASFADWRRNGEAARQALDMPRARNNARQLRLDAALAQLPAINDELAHQVQEEVDRRNAAIVDELEERRNILRGQVALSIALAAVLAIAFGVWLARPLRQIESAIGQLGGNRYDLPIDITGPGDLRRLGRHLDWLRQRLADLEADKARFLRHISHELKTPLAALVEGVALLEDEVAGPLVPKQREIAAILRQNTASLQNQIEDLLRYNAASFDAQHLQRESVDVGALLRQVVDSQLLQWQAKSLVVMVEGAAAPLWADSAKLSIVASNLLSNAVRFSPEGGTVRFLLGEANGMLRIDCVDQGPGVAPGDAQRVFEPFYQGERQPPGARRGNGIGLSIVREYVIAHGGTLQLLPSSPGAHFRIELPYEN